MEIGTILLLTLFCALCRCFIFNRSGIKWWVAFIPGVNKYKIGKLVGSKKLAIYNGISHVVFWLYFTYTFGYELYVLQNYATAVSNDGYGVEVTVPAEIANVITYTRYATIALAIFVLVGWCMMMWKFTILHKKSPWWIILWAVCPVIPYIYFNLINDFIAIDGKHYMYKKVDYHE